MKTLPILILICSTAGCATVGSGPGFSAYPVSSADEATSAPTTIAAPLQDQDTSPRFIIPATGGVPVIGIPLGGNFYLPVTGGGPVIGMPTAP
jgi:hypothetical protein